MSSWVDQAKRYVHAHDVATAAASATDAAPPPPPDWLLAAARLRSHRIREPTGGLVRATRERVRKRRAERKKATAARNKRKKARERAAAAAKARKAQKLKAATAVTDALPERYASAATSLALWRALSSVPPATAPALRAALRRLSELLANEVSENAQPLVDALAAAAARDPLDEAALAAARDACRPVFEDAHVGRTYVNAAGTAVVVLFKVPEEGDDEALWVIGARQEGGVYDGVQIVRFPTWAVAGPDAGDLAGRGAGARRRRRVNGSPRGGGAGRRDCCCDCARTRSPRARRLAGARGSGWAHPAERPRARRRARELAPRDFGLP